MRDAVTERAEGRPRCQQDSSARAARARFCNDHRGTGKATNAVFEARKGYANADVQMWIKSTSGIKKGGEILTDYGEGYWGKDRKQDHERLKKRAGPWDGVFFTHACVNGDRAYFEALHAKDPELGNLDGSAMEHDRVEVKECLAGHPR